MHKLRTTNSAGRIFKSDKDYLNKLNICEEEADALTAIMAASCITKRRHIEENKRLNK